jgi:hypothetical protein
MPEVLITADTELSSSLHKAGIPVTENFERSILGRVGGEQYGVNWLMHQLDAAGLKGVFFVDPLPALVFGQDVVDRMVGPILSRGHDVQVHIHTEWLQWAVDPPVAGTGRNIRDFSLDEQITLIGLARDLLVRAGAPLPTAFRAGNFGANDDTLAALAALGMRWDSSLNAAYLGRDCGITLSPDAIDPVRVCDVYEVPVAGIWDLPGHFRPAQVCAMSAREMRDGLQHAVTTGAHSFCIVTHSFEMLSRDRQRPNRIVMKRFEALCTVVSENSKLRSATFADISPPAAGGGSRPPSRLGPSSVRTLARIAEQALATWRFERL